MLGVFLLIVVHACVKCLITTGRCNIINYILLSIGNKWIENACFLNVKVVNENLDSGTANII